ncbi:trypsin-like peptidase domain-containing protein [Streptomyces sp. NPDC023723]|uniref:trypsin-like peptidase domain-containing protein n=1 Tax=Streptomyces sp. NPDC023723 TaxID=3154323 RepID=UPI003400EEB2
MVRIHDLAGRPRGTGFVADHHGTVVTSHEAVDGLPRLVLHGARDRRCTVTADAVVPLPGLNLALVRTEGLGLAPLPLTAGDGPAVGSYVRIAAGGWREARVLGIADVTYTSTDGFHFIGAALELAVGTLGRDALRLGGGAAGGPVLDATTGAVLGVLGTALRSGHSGLGFAVPLRPAHVPGPLAELLAENAATVPAYGTDLNPAGVLELTATSVGQDRPAGAPVGRTGAVLAAPPVERAATVGEFAAFAESTAYVLGLVGAPGSGRTTELAALADRRGRGPRPAPTLWLRGADLRADDMSVADAAGRALERAARIVAAAVGPDGLNGFGGARVGPGRGEAGRGGTGDWDLVDGGGGAGPAGQEGTGSPVGRAVLEDSVAPGGPLSVAGPLNPRRTEGPVSAAPVAPEAPPVPKARETPQALTAPPAPTPLDAEAPPGAPAPTAHASGAGLGDVSPERLARLAREAGRPLLVLLDGPEEMPAGLDRRLSEWSAGTAAWLRRTGTRLVVACRGEYWERAGTAFPRDLLYAPVPDPAPTTVPPGSPPPRVPLGDLTEAEARQARARLRVPDGALAPADARHPLTLRLYSEVRAALDDPTGTGGQPAPLRRDDVFAAHLDLVCLRIATRLATENGLRGGAVRRLAAKVSGQVHEAARRILAPGQGELDRASFEVVFPWATGWASAVLAEGLLVPAGHGYRFAHEELADWLQGLHLDLDEALRALVHEPPPPVPPVPHHRIGPVVEALLLLARQHGTARLTERLRELTRALDADPYSWWTPRLLAGVLARVPDPVPYTDVLRRLADAVAARREEGRPVPHEFGPAFWTALPVSEATRLDLFRRLVRADGPPHEPGPRHLDTVAALLAGAPETVQPLLVRWFDDERPLPAAPHATVATAAQALLHTHRRRAPDDLVEVLADSAHHRAGELLGVLAEEEPSALCRAVDRWARDERHARRAAAVTYGLRAAPHARTETDRQLLRYGALALLVRSADSPLHGAALALLVQDPSSRDRHLERALRHFAAGDPYLPPSALAVALPTHPAPVLDAFRARLRAPDAGEALRRLADAATPEVAGRVAQVLADAVAERPETAGQVAGYLDRRLGQDPAAARATLLPLVTGLLASGPEPLRSALATVLGAPDSTYRASLREELRDILLEHEREPAVLEALLRAAVLPGHGPGDGLRALVRRIGRRLVRTPEGVARFDTALVTLARQVPGFAARLAGWLAGAPEEWSALVGPDARRTVEGLAGLGVPA